MNDDQGGICRKCASYPFGEYVEQLGFGFRFRHCGEEPRLFLKQAAFELALFEQDGRADEPGDGCRKHLQFVNVTLAVGLARLRADEEESQGGTGDGAVEGGPHGAANTCGTDRCLPGAEVIDGRKVGLNREAAGAQALYESCVGEGLG
ncbi:MAG: hypothetical protein AB7J35_17715 [Dehalococcoidia bacterium]